MPRRPRDELGTKYRELDSAVRIDSQDEGAIRPDVLLTFPYEYPERQAEVLVETEEFSALCPWTGLPDLGTLVIRYVPDRAVVELKSLKLYLLSYRSVGIVQEHAANRILADLVAAAQPRKMTVELDYRVRGGLHTVVTVSHP
jgi:7-cyano-7-deazaguanine reductase